MKVSRAWLQTYFDKPIPAAEKLAELFTFHSFEVEGLEKIAADAVLDVKILPDRAHYCLSHRGVAEEVGVLTKMPLKKNAAAVVPVSIDRTPTVTIEDPQFCRRFTARFVEVIHNVSSDGASTPIKNSLEAIGQRSINPVVDATNFVMLDIGQPTHAFDADTIVGDIVIRAAKTGEKITLLDGKKYALTPDDHVIADAEGPLDIAGVKGGKGAEVTAATTNILITSANFHPVAVRRTSTRLNLRNEASKRFENEITPELAIEGLEALSKLVAKMSPSAKFGPVVDKYPTKAMQTTITLDPSYISERLGVEVPEDTVRDILQRMDIVVDSQWSLTIPFRRLDLTIPEDIVEEVGRIYGYERIDGKLPAKNVASAGSSEFYFVEKIKDILVVAGFSEIYLYTLAAKGDIEVAYPLASDKAALRTTLAAGLSKCLETNARNADLLGLDAVKIFEVGKVFTKKTENTETLVLALGATQVKKTKGVDGKSLITEALERIKAVTGVELPVKSLLSSGQNAVCEIELDRRSVSELPGIPDSGRSPHPAAMPRTSYKPFSSYPFIVRDIAVFVPAETAGAEGVTGEKEVWTEMEKSLVSSDSTELLVRHSLFDTFAKEGKVSYAFRLVFQAMDRTLTDVEANAIMADIYARMSARGWQVR